MKLSHIITIFIVLLIAAIPMSADRHKNSRKNALKPKTTKTAPVTYVYDTITPSPTDVTIAGYDKPLSSSSESFFLSNHLSRPIHGISFTIEYRDAENRMLHRKTREHRVFVPIGETRQVDFPSWDRQNRFYYIRSRSPRISAIPYDIIFTVNYILLTPDE